MGDFDDHLGKLEVFQWASSLYLNICYYMIHLDPDAQKICMLRTPRGKYQYLHLFMGISCISYIFQEKMSDLMHGLKFAQMFLDDLLCLSMGDLDDHLGNLKLS